MISGCCSLDARIFFVGAVSLAHTHAHTHCDNIAQINTETHTNRHAHTHTHTHTHTSRSKSPACSHCSAYQWLSSSRAQCTGTRHQVAARCLSVAAWCLRTAVCCRSVSQCDVVWCIVMQRGGCCVDHSLSTVSLMTAMVMRHTPCTGHDGARNASNETAKPHMDARYGMRDRILPSAAHGGSHTDRALSTVGLRDHGLAASWEFCVP